MTETAPKRPWWRRLRIRISMRTLMVLVLLIGGGFGWIVRGARIQREAVAAIEKVGGVDYDWQWDSDRAENDIPTRDQPATPKWLLDWVGVDYFHHVVAVNLYGEGPNVINADLMAQVGRLDRLEDLSLRGDLQVTDELITHFRGLTRLRGLSMEVNSGTPGSFLAELKNLEGLENLALSDVTDSDLAHLENLTQIKKLILYSTEITDAGVAHLAGLTGLEELTLNCEKITNAGLAALGKMSRLNSLELEDVATITSIYGLGARDSLKNLKLSYLDIGDAGLKALAEFPGLISLDLGGTKITDEGLVHLRGLTSLTHLDLTRTQITNAGLAQIAGLTELQSLRLIDTKIGDAGLVPLAGLNKLTSLSLGGTQITDQGIINLRGLKSCKEVTVQYTAVTAAGMAAAAKKRPEIRFCKQTYPCIF